MPLKLRRGTDFPTWLFDSSSIKKALFCGLEPISGLMDCKQVETDSCFPPWLMLGRQYRRVTERPLTYVHNFVIFLSLSQLQFTDLLK